MTVTIVLVNFNGYSDTVRCLKSLEKISVPRTTVVNILVIDNGSQDRSAERLGKKFPKIQVIATGQNLGFTGGNNVGIKQAVKLDSDFILLLNNDTTVHPQFLKYLVEAAERHPDGGVFAPKIYFYPGNEFHKQKYQKSDQGKVIWAAGGSIDWQNMYGNNRGIDEVDSGQFNNLEPIEMASGCCILLTRKAVNKLKGLDDRYFMYYEDVDLSIRARRAGMQIYYVPEAQIWHVNAGSSGVGSDLNDYFVTRNRLLVGLKFAPWRTKQALVRESWRFLWSGRPWQKRGVKDCYLKRLGSGSFPV